MKCIKYFAAVLIVLVASSVCAEDVTYFHNDALGSPVAATDKYGDLQWQAAYMPYGAKHSSSDKPVGDVDYTGHLEDEDLSLTYMQARYYDPAVGRFYSNDPVGFTPNNLHSFNRYAYANNNPYKYVDPDGRESRFAIRFDNRVERLYSGEITAQEYNAEMRAEGVGAVVGLSLISPVDELGLAVAAIGKVGINAVRAAKISKAAKAIGTSKKGLKHIAKHTDEFKKFDSEFNLEKQVELGKQIAANPKNLVNEVNGSKGYEALMKIGKNEVKVRSVVNSAGNLRTVYPVK